MLRKFTACTVTRLEPQSDTQLQINFNVRTLLSFCDVSTGSGIRGGGLGCSNPPPPEIPEALQNRAKLNPIVKTVKNC